MRMRATLLENWSERTVLDQEPVKNPIRLGVVGLGCRSVGNVLPKAIAYEDYRLISVCDVRGDVVKKVVSMVEQEHGLKIRGYTNYEEMLKKEELDAVAVQVDVDKQVPLACQAMESGRHVMMEVPVAYSIEDCWRIVTTTERTGKVFLLMEQLRYGGYIRAWRQIIQQGVIGKPVFAEGEYFGDKPDAYFQDERGVFYRADQAKRNPQAKPTWRHKAETITYLPHELSPLLYALDDRVTRVVGMTTRRSSYRYDNLKRADFQVALMHTEKDVVLRIASGHSLPSIHRGDLGSHWHHIKGTEGVLEWKRAADESCKLWVKNWQMYEPAKMPWGTGRTDAPREAAGSGHGDIDYYVFACFADAVLRGEPLEFDVYRAVETAAPAILAAQSILDDNRPQDVPDFRPGPHRKPGEMLKIDKRRNKK
jgi:predicted dehydrogenase